MTFITEEDNITGLRCLCAASKILSSVLEELYMARHIGILADGSSLTCLFSAPTHKNIAPGLCLQFRPDIPGILIVIIRPRVGCFIIQMRAGFLFQIPNLPLSNFNQFCQTHKLSLLSFLLSKRCCVNFHIKES